MLLGLADPSAGSLAVLGRRPAAAARSGAIAGVLQTGGLLSDLTVRETVEVIASLHGRDALARVPGVLASADLEPIARRRIAKCSGGEQQRVKFALALVADPDVLVLDEPTAGMDVNARRHFWDVMRADAAAGRPIAKCSGGERLRVKFALPLVADPVVLVLDEPTAGMDWNARRHFWDVWRADADAGRAFVFATHYLE